MSPFFCFSNDKITGQYNLFIYFFFTLIRWTSSQHKFKVHIKIFLIRNRISFIKFFFWGFLFSLSWLPAYWICSRYGCNTSIVLSKSYTQISGNPIKSQLMCTLLLFSFFFWTKSFKLAILIYSKSIFSIFDIGNKIVYICCLAMIHIWIELYYFPNLN